MTNDAESTSGVVGMTVNVGIDVGKDNLDICLLHDQTKSGRNHRKFKHKKGTHSEINCWLLKVSKCKPNDILVTIGSTGVYHESIAFYLHAVAFRVFIANQGKVHKLSQSLRLAHKTDKSDSYMLGLYGEAQGEHAQIWDT